MTNAIRRVARVSVLTIGLAPASAPASAAQQAPQILAGRLDIQNPRGDHFGAALAAAGDVDGDGVPDLIVGAPQPRPDQPGYAAIHSGSDGALIRRIEGRAPEDFCGFAVAGGEDVDGDGRADQAVAALNWRRSIDGGGSYVTVRSGADGSLLHELAAPAGTELYGHALLLLGDCDGDGRSELVVAAPSADITSESLAGQVFVHDGATGEVRFALHGGSRSELFGLALAAAGDLDADGAPDFLIGSPGVGDLRQGAVHAVSGKTGATLFELRGEERNEQLGVALSARADIDGDGRRDLVVSAHGHAFTKPGSVSVISAATKSKLFTRGEEFRVFHPGRGLALSADLDGDGAQELLCADPSAPGPALRMYELSGEHEDILGIPSQPEGGVHICILGDVDAAGADDFAVGCPWARPGAEPLSAGAVTVFSGRTRTPLFTLWGS